MELRFSLSHSFNCTKDLILPFLKDIKKFGEIHPLITNVTQLSPTRFEVTEPVVMAKIPVYSNKYTIDYSEDGEIIHYFGNVKGIVKIYIDFSFHHGSSNNIILKENVRVTGPFLMLNILRGMMIKIHTKMFAGLNQQLSPKSNNNL